MRIAISAEQDNGLASWVGEHFGRCRFFVLADVKDGKVVSVYVVANPYCGNHQPGQVPAFIQSQRANVMLSGGMGAEAISYFNQYGISVATGASGTVLEAIEKYLAGKLSEVASCPADHDRHARC